MGRGRGSSRGRGRGAGTGTVVSSPTRVQQEQGAEDDPPEEKKRGRGRPSKAGNESAGGLPYTLMQKLKKALPVLDTDKDPVTCSECRESFTFRQFRLHNIQYHMNTVPTMEEKLDLVMDHKYFSRKLNEYKKLTKVTVFACPRKGCTSSFKSTLGLAYHMNTCGRSAEELDAVLITCDICNAKLTLPNMQWHRKTHEERPTIIPEAAEAVKQISGKRKSAINARKSFKSLGQGKGIEPEEDDEEWIIGGTDIDPEENSPRSHYSHGQGNHGIKVSNVRVDCNDFNTAAVQFLETLNTEQRTWNPPNRSGEDPFIQLKDNVLSDPRKSPDDNLDEYLPTHKKSVEFNSITPAGASGYHNLDWFEGETVEAPSSKPPSSIHHVGGPVLSMSWHPSGKLLGISVARDIKEEIDALKCNPERKGCLQIYTRTSIGLSLQLVLVLDFGYATHIQWSSFFPDIIDSYDPKTHSCFDDIEILCRIGYMAMACEDSTVRIMAVRIEDLKLKPNYEYKPGHWIRVYKKCPEFCLKVDSSVIENELGNVVKFDWHEGNKFLGVGFASGAVAVFDLHASSPLLVKKEIQNPDTVVTINPFWFFPGHHLSVRGICFDPLNPRYLVTAGQDRVLRVWDIETRLERDNKRIGIALDMCWIRGWLHQATCCESHVAYQSAMHNYVRVFQIGSNVGRPTSADLFNFTTLDFYHGLTVQGTDDGKVYATYYDSFWRECDFERNRKKKNLVALCSIQLDPESYSKISGADFNVNLRKLSKSVWASKIFQRTGINEDTGVYAVSLEAKFPGSKIYEELPNPDNWSDEEMDEVSESQEENLLEKKLFALESSTPVAGVDESKRTETEDVEDDDVIEEAIDSVQQTLFQKDGIVSVLDVNIPDETPKLLISFVKARAASLHPTEGFQNNQLEEYVRFQNFIRVNKVAFSPNGGMIAVGFRNGFVSLLPGSFESIFS